MAAVFGDADDLALGSHLEPGESLRAVGQGHGRHGREDRSAGRGRVDHAVERFVGEVVAELGEDLVRACRLEGEERYDLYSPFVNDGEDIGSGNRLLVRRHGHGVALVARIEHAPCEPEVEVRAGRLARIGHGANVVRTQVDGQSSGVLSTIACSNEGQPGFGQVSSDTEDLPHVLGAPVARRLELGAHDGGHRIRSNS